MSHSQFPDHTLEVDHGTIPLYCTIAALYLHTQCLFLGTNFLCMSSAEKGQKAGWVGLENESTHVLFLAKYYDQCMNSKL